MPMELAYRPSSHGRDSIEPQTADRANVPRADQSARSTHAVVHAVAPEFVARPLTRHYPASVAAPRAYREAGATVIEINPQETEISDMAHLHVRAPVAVALPPLVAALRD